MVRERELHEKEGGGSGELQSEKLQSLLGHLPHEDGEDCGEACTLQLRDVGHVDPVLLELINLVERLVIILHTNFCRFIFTVVVGSCHGYFFLGLFHLELFQIYF